MRTTVTLDDDVAAELERLRQKRKLSFNEILNDVLRQGLARKEPGKGRARFETKAVDLGACLIGSVDDVAEALAIAEGDAEASR